MNSKYCVSSQPENKHNNCIRHSGFDGLVSLSTYVCGTQKCTGKIRFALKQASLSRSIDLIIEAGVDVDFLA